YGYIYFGNLNNGDGGYLTFILGNYKRELKKTFLILDRNNNHDFSDDKTDTIAPFQSIIDLSICNDDNCKYKVILSRFGFSEQQSYKAMLDEYYKLYEGTRKYIGADYGFVEQRNNMRSGKFIAGEDTAQIALRDENYNGRYNDNDDR